MDVFFRSGDAARESADALIVPVAAPANGGEPLTGPAAQLDADLEGELARLAADARFSGKHGSTLVVPTLGRLPARRIVLAGVGTPDDLDAEAVRRAWGAAAIAARDAGAARVASTMPPSGTGLDPAASLAAAAEAAALAVYRFTKHFGAGRRDDPAPRTLDALAFVDEGLDQAEADAALARGAAIAAGAALARDLVNEPASVLDPAAMADHARRVAETHGLVVEVLGPPELATIGAGALLAVGKGSASEPRLIRLTYRPESDRGANGQTGSTAQTMPRTIGLVGKCITFDTGGYSIKPYEGMLEMKGDMAGGAAVLGAMTALRALGCRHTVHGIIPAAENMISGTAFRPGDILTAMNGVTIEILSTDAEGRLVLADGLVYAARQGAEELIDLATLTGAAVVALGDGTTALFADDDALATRLLDASAAVGERFWRMPLIAEFNDKIKGDVGDIKNTGGRQGGAITAALFLQRFTEGKPWAHLDIAGSARAAKGNGYVPKGATGVGVRTLLAYLTA